MGELESLLPENPFIEFVGAFLIYNEYVLGFHIIRIQKHIILSPGPSKSNIYHDYASAQVRGIESIIQAYSSSERFLRVEKHL